MNIPQTEKNRLNTGRTWTDNEYYQALKEARERGRDDVVQAMQLGHHFSMRTEEVTALHSNQLQCALKMAVWSCITPKAYSTARDVSLETNTQREIT